MTARSMVAGFKGLVPIALAVASVALAGCGRAQDARQITAKQSASLADGRRQTMPSVEIVGAGHRWLVRLTDSPSTKDFLAELPLKLTLKDYAGTEKIADLPRKLTLEGAPAAITPAKGDVTFYSPWGNLAIFYKDGHHSPGLVPLGKIDGDLTGLDGSEPVSVTIRQSAGAR